MHPRSAPFSSGDPQAVGSEKALNRVEVVRLLCEARANKNAVDMKDRTPLDLALAPGCSPRNCEWLIKAVMVYLTADTWITVVILRAVAEERGGPTAARHPTIRAFRKLGLRTAMETSRELRGEVVEIEDLGVQISETRVVKGGDRRFVG